MWMRCDHGNNNIIGLVPDGKVPARLQAVATARDPAKAGWVLFIFRQQVRGTSGRSVLPAYQYKLQNSPWRSNRSTVPCNCRRATGPCMRQV